MTQEDISRPLFDILDNKISNLQTHILNLLHRTNPLELSSSDCLRLDNLISIFSKPFKIDDSAIREYLNESRKIAEKLLDLSKDLDFVQTLAEIKYIGKRLKEIEQNIQEIKNDGIPRTIKCHFSLEGVEKVSEEEIHENYKSKFALEELLQNLTFEEKMCVIFRCKLNGHQKLSYQIIGDKLGFSNNKARELFCKAIRKLSQPIYKNYIQLLDPVFHLELLKEITKK